MRTEIVTTKNSLLKETGFGAQDACDAFKKSISGKKQIAVVTVCSTLDDLFAVVSRKPELLVLAVKYIALESGELIWLSEFFEAHGISYTGSRKANLLYDSDKVLAKQKVDADGIATAAFFITTPDEFKNEADLPLPLPLFIKPMNAANGNGIDRASIAETFEQYESKVKALHFEYDASVLVETLLVGREFTAAAIEYDGKLTVSAVEVMAPDEGGFKFLGSKVKTENSEVLSRISDLETRRDVIALVRQAFVSLGARDFARIDVKMDQNGKCYFMEANLVPGMTLGTSYFPQSCKVESGLNYDHVVDLMVKGAISRIKPSFLSVTGTMHGRRYTPQAANEGLFVQ